MFFEGFGPNLQNDVAKLVLGVAEDLMLRLADQKPSHRDEFLIGQLADAPSQRLSFRFLLD
jgi:hypothetical protein